VGTVPGQSALAAAPAALEQLRQAAETTGNTAPANPPASAPAPSNVKFALTQQPALVAPGATFKISVVLTGGTDVAAVPLQMSYDPIKLSLLNVDNGDFLGRNGQAVALVHRDDGPGSINIHASLPPGAAGINGAGVVCVLTFQAKAAGDSDIAITRPSAVNSSQKFLTAQGARINIQVK
jgi:general secretion pathway protein D